MISLPEGFPSTEKQALDCCAAAGVPEDFVIHTWNKAMSRGGRDSQDIPIRSFVHYVAAEWRYERNRMAERGPGGAGKKPGVWELSKMADAVMDEIKELEARHGWEDPVSGWRCNDKAVVERRRMLKGKLKELKRRMTQLQ